MLLKIVIYLSMLTIVMFKNSYSQNMNNEMFFEGKFGLNTNATFVTDYLHRGRSLSNKKPAVQAGTHYRNWLGFYMGGWGSSGSKELPLEIDLYAGYRNTIISDLILDFKATGFLYPHNNSNNALELMAGIYYNFLGTRYHYDVDFKQHYFELGAEKYVYDKIWTMIRIGLIIAADQIWDYEIKTGYEINKKVDVFLKFTNHKKEGMRIAAGALVNVSLLW
jgi:uncharacterized protein (TIGR02001 family)